MKKVENAGKKGLALKRKPFKINNDHFFQEADKARLLFSKLINSEDKNRSVIIPSASYGIANVTRNLQKKGEVIVCTEQFPSNIYPWLSLRDEGYKVIFVEPGTSDMAKGKVWNQRLLEAINTNTVALAIGHVHWADGTLFDLNAIRKRLDDVDGLLIVDGTQSVGALPFDISAVGVDALICASYKWLMGPYGIGMAYYGERFDTGKPIEQNWITRQGSENFSELVNYQDEYREMALRYEVGERSNFILLPMLNAALKEVIKWTPEEIQVYCGDLTKPLISEVQKIGFEVEDDGFRSKHLFGLRLPIGIDGALVLKHMKSRKVSVSVRGNAIRVSPHVYNDEKDVNKLLNALYDLV